MKEIKKSFFPVFEWTTPSSAIMGGFSLDKEKFAYQKQYLSYLEELSKHIKVLYFANDECKVNIEDQINCTNIDFINYQLDSIWIRDYAPIWLQCSKTLEFKLVNFPYGANHFGKSERDDNFSLKLSEIVGLPLELDFPRKEIPFYLDGGNIFVDDEKNCFTSIRKDDPPLVFREKLLAHINCDKVIAMNAIPGETTGHVDTFMKVLPNKKVLLARYQNPTFRDEMNKNKMILDNLGYEVIEVPHSDNEGCTNWSYLNSLIIENKAFVPQYDIDEDEKALKVYEEVGFSVIPIEARTIMKEKGSLHCITNFIYSIILIIVTLH
jgi:agmatine/peptidylarginine deiminase